MVCKNCIVFYFIGKEIFDGIFYFFIIEDIMFLVLFFIWNGVLIINDVMIIWFVNELVLVNCMFIILFMILVFFCDFGLWFGNSF